MTLALQLFSLVILILGYIFLSDLFMKGIRKLFKITNDPNSYMALFNNVLLFTLFIVALTAIISTKGKTVFVFVLPVLFTYFRYFEKFKPNSDEINTTNRAIVFWPIVSLITLITVLLSFFMILKFSIRNDVSFYTKITENLIPQGIENPFHYYNNDNPLFMGNVPYHYFEMWFGGICFQIAKVLGVEALSNYLIYIFFVFNLFRAVAIIGIFGLITKYVKLSYVHFIVVYFLMIIDISAYCNWGNDSYVAESNFYERPNFIFYYLFLVPIFYSVLNDRKEETIIWGILFVIATITALPAIAGSIFIYFTYYWFKNKASRKQILYLIGVFIAFIICYLTFYKIFGPSKEASLVEAMSVKEMIAKTLSIWKACVFMFGMLFFKIGIIVLLSVIIIARTFHLIGKVSFLKLHFFTILTCFCGIGIFQLIPYLDNMYQFAFVGYCAVLLLIMLVISIWLSNLNGSKHILGLSLFLVVAIYGYKRNLFFDHILVERPNWNENIRTNFLLQNKLSRKYINKLSELDDYFEMHKGVSIIDGKDALGEFLGLRHSMTFQLGNYLMAIGNNVNLPLVSDPSKLYPDPDKSSKDYYKAITFNQKTEFYRSYNGKITYNQNLSNYLKKNHIDFVMASKYVDPYMYFDSAMIDKVLKDSNKGHQLILLNNE